MMKSAESVLNHIKDAGKPCALFAFYGGTYKTLVAQGNKARKMIQDFPDTFVGVYTEDCPLEWLQEDMECSRL